MYMATQVLCDSCQEPIDLTQPYYQVTAVKVQVENANDPSVPNQPVTVEIAQQFDYHDGHQPHSAQASPEVPDEEEPISGEVEHPIVLPDEEPPSNGDDKPPKEPK
jgi:hypothetical protein